MPRPAAEPSSGWDWGGVRSIGLRDVLWSTSTSELYFMLFKLRTLIAGQVICLLGLVVSGCGGGSEPTSPVRIAPADSSSRIGAGGGSVTVGLADGGSATLTIPAQTISGDTVIRVSVLAPAAGDRVRLRVEPAGLLLRNAATIAITLPEAPVADAAIVLRGDSLNVTLATTRQGRTLSATSRLLGLAVPPTGLPALRRASREMALTDGDDGEIVVTAVAVRQRVQQLDALIAKVNNEPAAVAAIWINLQLAAIAQSGAPAAQFLNNARTLICQQYFDRLRDFNQDVMDQPGDFTLGLRRVFTWVSVLNAAGLQDNCPQGLVEPAPVIAAKSAEFFAFLQQRITSIDFERDFEQFYESELVLQLGFAEALEVLAVPGTDDESSTSASTPSIACAPRRSICASTWRRAGCSAFRPSSSGRPGSLTMRTQAPSSAC